MSIFETPRKESKKMQYFIIIILMSLSLNSQTYSIKEELNNLPYIDFNRRDFLNSSYDRQGGNIDDDLSTIDGNERKVVFDENGPGEIYRFWKSEATIFDTLYFYFDGENEASLKLNQFLFFFGEMEGAKFPISYNYLEGSGGAFSYARIRFNESLKIEMNAPAKRYFHINYSIFSDERKFENTGLIPTKENPVELLDGFANWSDNPMKKSSTFTISKIENGNNDALELERNDKTRITKFKLKIDDLVVGDPLERIDGWYHAFSGSSSFNFQLDPDNEGIMLVKRIDPKAGRIPVEVLIDGVSAATFSGKPFNYNYRMENDTVIIPAEFTSGKNIINIKSKPVNPNDVPNESYFWCYEKIDGEYRLGDETTIYWWEGGQDHQYQVEGSHWVGPVKYSYKPQFDPNKEKNSDILYKTFIKIYFDNKEKPSIEAPLGLFFGISTFNAVNTHSLVNGIDSLGYMFMNFPMIFENKMRIEVENNSGFNLSNLEFIITEEAETSHKSYGYLTTFYNEKLPITGFKDHIFGRFQGSGKFLGVMYESDMPNSFSDGHLEGDERFSVDNFRFPQWHGTGSEDYFNGAFYFVNGPYESPYSGQIFVDSLKRNMHRFHFFDPVNFLRNGKFTMEHGTNNTWEPYHRSLSFFYLNDTTFIHPTDSLELALQGDLARTNYSLKGDFFDKVVYSGFPNEDFYKGFESKVKYYDGIVDFKMKIFKENKGVRLVKFFDDSIANQTVDVYVDDSFVATWRDYGSNPFLRYKESAFEIPKKFTKDKDSIKITLNNQKYGTNSDIKYWVYTKGILPNDPINSVKNNDNIYIYPNPAENTLKIKGSTNSPSNIRIFNLNGRILLEKENYDLTRSLNIKDLTKGFYVLEIRNKEFQKSFKFIKI